MAPYNKRLSEDQYQNLMHDAVRVSLSADEVPPYKDGETCIRTVKTQVEVPVEETVQVPVEKKLAKHYTEKKVVHGKKLVPVQKVKEVEETSVEVKEEVVDGYRWVWKKVKEPTKEVVKKPVTVTKMRKVPYTDYEERDVEMVVDVPCDRVEVQHGYREDKKISTKMVEVEQDEIYALRPLYVGKGEMRYHDINGAHQVGIRHGREVFAAARSECEGPRGRLSLPPMRGVSEGPRDRHRVDEARVALVSSSSTSTRSTASSLHERSHDDEAYGNVRGASYQRPPQSMQRVVPPSTPRAGRGRPQPHRLVDSMASGDRSIM